MRVRWHEGLNSSKIIGDILKLVLTLEQKTTICHHTRYFTKLLHQFILDGLASGIPQTLARCSLSHYGISQIKQKPGISRDTVRPILTYHTVIVPDKKRTFVLHA